MWEMQEKGKKKIALLFGGGEGNGSAKPPGIGQTGREKKQN